MSFSTEIKNEVCSLKLSRVENISFLSGFVRNNKLEDVNKISLVTENPKIIRYLYNLFKEIYGVSPLIEKGKSNNFNKNTYYNYNTISFNIFRTRYWCCYNLCDYFIYNAIYIKY